MFLQIRLIAWIENIEFDEHTLRTPARPEGIIDWIAGSSRLG
jgi:hypothetical protein